MTLKKSYYIYISSEQEIIYYARAIEYLSKNDPSLMESLELAHEYGYAVEKLNSEVLATLHYQNALMRNAGECAEKLTALLMQKE